MTDVARQLARPEAPPKPTYSDPWVVGGIVLGLLVVCGCAEVGGQLQGIAFGPPDQPKTYDYVPTVGCWVVVVIGVVITILLTRQVAEKRKKLFNEEVRRWKAAHDVWERAVAIWDGLYYCRDEDLIFHPDDPERRWASRWVMRQFLSDLVGSA